MVVQGDGAAVVASSGALALVVRCALCDLAFSRCRNSVATRVALSGLASPWWSKVLLQLLQQVCASGGARRASHRVLCASLASIVAGAHSSFRCAPREVLQDGCGEGGPEQPLLAVTVQGAGAAAAAGV